MGKRQQQWAGKVHHELRTKLGGKCQVCGREEDLELDCILPCGHEHHRKGYVFRATFYRKQLKAGNLSLLCAACHEDKTQSDEYWHGETIIGARSARNPAAFKRWLQSWLKTF